jgi:hypothetical protein
MAGRPRLLGLQVDDEAVRRVGGVAARQLLIRSVRSSTSSTSASRPTASDDTCSTVKAPAARRSGAWPGSASAVRAPPAPRGAAATPPARPAREHRHRGGEAPHRDGTQLQVGWPPSAASRQSPHAAASSTEVDRA